MIRLEFKRPIDDHSSLLQLFVRLIGLLWIVLLADTAWQWDSLCGQDGLLPAAEFAEKAMNLYRPWQFFRFPSFFWVSQEHWFFLVMVSAGLLGGLMAMFDRLATLGLCLAWSVWLSFVNFGGEFFAQPWDTFMLELGFLAVFASWLRNAGVGRKLVLAALILLNFRLWLSFGIVKIVYPGAEGLSISFLDDFLVNQPMPTQLAWVLFQAPVWVKDVLSILVLLIQVGLPVLLLMPRLRWIPAVGFAFLSLGMSLIGNYGIFGLASLLATLPLWLGTGLGTRLGNWLAKREWWNKYLRIDPQYQRLRGWPRRGGAAVLQFQMAAQVFYLVMLFFPLGNKDLNFLNYTAYRPEVVAWEGESSLKAALLTPLRATSNFRIANPYGFRKVSTSPRFELRFEATKDSESGFWHPYPYNYKPGSGTPPSFFAPVFPRFEQQMHHLAEESSFYESMSFHHLWGQRPCWAEKMLKAMWQGDELDRWFAVDPLHGEKPEAIRVQLLRFTFSNPEQRESTGSWWDQQVVLARVFSRDETLPDCRLWEDL